MDGRSNIYTERERDGERGCEQQPRDGRKKREIGKNECYVYTPNVEGLINDWFTLNKKQSNFKTYFIHV